VYRELIETLATRSMGGIMLVMVFGTIASGLSAGLSFYLSTFFWEFSTQQISLLTVSLLISAVVSVVLSPLLSIRFGKKRGAFIVGLAALILQPAPVVLRLLGLMPENGDPLLFPIILVLQILDVGLVIVFQTLAFSMVADMVEDSEVRTKRRSEGVFFAAIGFARKINQGLGLVLASTLLTLIQFPTEATPGEISAGTITNLGLAYVPALVVPWTLMMLCLSLYSINRARHEENLRKLGRD
jgi:Na+/melibiose symporter-like transporter